MAQQFTDEDLGRRLVRLIQGQQLTATGWFPVSRIGSWWAGAGYGSGLDRAVQYAQGAGWLEEHGNMPHARLSDVGRSLS